MSVIEDFQRSLVGPFADLLQQNWMVVALVVIVAGVLVYTLGFSASYGGDASDISDLMGGGDGDGGGGDGGGGGD